jgi:deoxyuridine 5'-triphosphate nucleotidohydrolase
MRTKVKIQMLGAEWQPEVSVNPYIPKKAHKNDAAFDIMSRIDITIAPLQTVLVPTGFKIQLQPGFEAQIRPRSGNALKRGLQIANSPGTIDCGYTGEVGVIIYNANCDKYLVVSRGDKIAQMIIQELPKINLVVNNRSLLSLAEEIKNSWANILGIEVTLSVINQIDYQNFDAILSYSSTTKDPDQYSFWHSTQTNTNITKLDNSRIDKLLEDGRTTIDTIERKKIYQDFQRYLLEESPAIFISYPITYQVIRQK